MLPLTLTLAGGVSLLDALKIILCLIITYVIVLPLYRLYIHPLSCYSGPKLLAITNLIHIYHVLRGSWVHKVLALHEKYGPVVRVAPNEISYITEEAWNDIYKTPRSQEQLKKFLPATPKRFENGLFDNKSDEEHQFIRKKLSPALSDHGIQAKEAVLRKHVDFMMKRLKDQISTSGKAALDVVDWFQSVTTDVIGDFLTQEDFGTLANGKAHSMMPSNYAELKGLAVGTAFTRNFWLRNLVVKMNPPPRLTLHDHIAKERFDRYLSEKRSNGNDLVGLLSKDMDTEKGLSKERAFRVASDFILAGTDTVAITLAGATYLLLRNPVKLQKLQDEVRSSFSTANDITGAGINALKYTNAVIKETLRLWPPGPETTRRVANEGGKVIGGQYVPAGTLVGVYHWAAGRYSGAWKDASSFVPERWLPDNAEYRDDKHGVTQPYSAGARNCVGQSLAQAELRLILAMIMWEFDMQLEDPEDAEWMNTRVFGLVAEKRPLMVKLKEVTRV